MQAISCHFFPSTFHITLIYFSLAGYLVYYYICLYLPFHFQADIIKQNKSHFCCLSHIYLNKSQVERPPPIIYLALYYNRGKKKTQKIFKEEKKKIIIMSYNLSNNKSSAYITNKAKSIHDKLLSYHASIEYSYVLLVLDHDRLI